MPATSDIPSLTILTAGGRLARHLLETHARDEIARGREAWETPDILPLPAWLERLWLELVETGEAGEILLTPAQELVVWERIVGEWAGASHLLQPSAAARTAREAWALVQAWRLPLDIHGPASEDARAFARWAARYVRECERESWLDAARLTDRLREAIAARRLPLPQRIELAGFDEFTPQQQALLDALAATGCALHRRAPEPVRGTVRRIGFASAEDERRAAAQWIGDRLAHSPTARIGLVVPDLGTERAAVLRALEDCLVPQAVLPGNEDIERPFNVSLGMPLADYPLAHDALAMLRLGVQLRRDGSLETALASTLLRSPFLGGAQAEELPRALLDAELRATREARLRFDDIPARAAAKSCPQLAARLQAWRDAFDRLPRSQAPGSWAASLAGLLGVLGWPGERGLSSAEYQTLEAWRDQLGMLATLDAVLPGIGYEQAVQQLTQAAREHLFQPRSREVSVQVLGALEAAGQRFDGLWILGLHEEAWPLAPRPNPLLPVALQRRHGVPHASPERELEFARVTTERLLASGDEVVVSYSWQEGDRLRGPSPLIAALPEIASGPDKTLRYGERAFALAAIETFDDWSGPPVPAGSVAGGTAVLTAQSACPFQAFAGFRLGAESLSATEAAPGPLDRGSVIHWALEDLWRQLGSHARLLALDPAARADLVRRVAHTAVERLQRRRPFALGKRLAQMEKARIEALLQDWLACEAARAPFRVIATEQRASMRLDGLAFEARLDRLDELEGGELAVMDYKTGDPKPAYWFDERPREPQLPLYATFGVPADRKIGAVVYARLKRGACRFAGIARDGAWLPGVSALGETDQAAEFGDWAGMEQAWRERLLHLAREFARGLASATPRDEQVCRGCAQQPLCRIHELNEQSGRWVLEDAGD